MHCTFGRAYDTTHSSEARTHSLVCSDSLSALVFVTLKNIVTHTQIGVGLPLSVLYIRVANVHMSKAMQSCIRTAHRMRAHRNTEQLA